MLGYTLIYAALVIGGFIILYALMKGLFSFAYRFIPGFRNCIDEFYKTLPMLNDNVEKGSSE